MTDPIFTVRALNRAAARLREVGTRAGDQAQDLYKRLPKDHPQIASLTAASLVLQTLAEAAEAAGEQLMDARL